MAAAITFDTNTGLSALEPSFKDMDKTVLENTLDRVLAESLNWYSRVKTWDDSVKYFMSYFKGEAISPAIPNMHIANAGFIARMVSRGFPLTPKLKKILDARLIAAKEATVQVKLEEAAKAAKEKETEKPTYEVKGAITDPKASEFLGGFDGHIDDILGGKTTSINIHTTFMSKQQKAIIKGYVERHLQGIEGLERDEKGFDAKTENLIRTFCAKVLNELGAAPIRKARAKKAVPIEKQIGKLMFSVKSEIKPEKIIGAKTLVAYDEKARKIRVYFSEDGLKVKGTTIIDYDEEKSYAKTLRKPDEQLVKIKSLPKMSMFKELDAIRSTNSKVNGRLHSEIILLKVF